MKNFGKWVVGMRIPILIISFVLLIPSFFGYVGTRVNYDILSYLPKDIETMVGQDILVEEFGTGAFSMFMVEGMKPKETAALKEKIETVNHVEKVIWYDTAMDISVPMELLPEDLYTAFNSGDCTLMIIIFDETTSADSTMDAIEEIRGDCGKELFFERHVGGGYGYQEPVRKGSAHLCMYCGCANLHRFVAGDGFLSGILCLPYQHRDGNRL